jgi:phosphatidylglycerol:prolipoprotein diacylglycerol transferase
MIPFLHIGQFSLPTFGLMLWVASLCACWVLYKSFKRANIDSDAVGIVAISTLSGIIGARLWHNLETPSYFFAHFKEMMLTTEGFAWFGGLLAGILALVIQGKMEKIGGLRILDLSGPAAAVGYAMGRIGCLTSGDGDYGIPTKLPWGMSFPHGLVPTTQRVHPTPIYELIVGLTIAWILWRRGAKPTPLGRLTGEYLVLTGIARFLVEFIRRNDKILLGLTNAQLASIGSVVAGVLLILWARHRNIYPAAAEVQP